ncbi:MAG: hypothetical protein IJ806_05375 [Ruminococcus sp.]|nr:hypothetical protein [Ruminococcus sp.]
MNGEKETLFQERCSEFRKIGTVSRAYFFISSLCSAALIYQLFLYIMLSAPAITVVVILLLIARECAAVFIHGCKGSITAAVMTIAAAVLLLYFKALETQSGMLLAVSAGAHIMRCRWAAAADRVSRLYGALGFGGLLLSMELEKDPELCKSVIESYENVSRETVVSLCLKEEQLPMAMTIVKNGALLLAVSGLCIAAGALSMDKSLSRALRPDSISAEDSGNVIRAVVDKVYYQSGAAIDDSIEDSYWCRINEQCLMVTVSGTDNKLRFFSLYNAFNDNDPYGMADLKTYEKKPEPIDIFCRVCKVSSYDRTAPDLKLLERNVRDIDVTAEDGFYLELIDRAKIKNKIVPWLTAGAIGAAAAAAYYFYLLKSAEEIRSLK